MIVYRAEYKCWDDCEHLGLFLTKELAEKYIQQHINSIFGSKGTHKVQDRYSIFEEEIIGE